MRRELDANSCGGKTPSRSCYGSLDRLELYRIASSNCSSVTQSFSIIGSSRQAGLYRRNAGIAIKPLSFINCITSGSAFVASARKVIKPLFRMTRNACTLLIAVLSCIRVDQSQSAESVISTGCLRSNAVWSDAGLYRFQWGGWLRSIQRDNATSIAIQNIATMIEWIRNCGFTMVRKNALCHGIERHQTASARSDLYASQNGRPSTSLQLFVRPCFRWVV